jgi:hypothetical protein
MWLTMFTLRREQMLDAQVADRNKRAQVVVISRQKQNDTLVLGC